MERSKKKVQCWKKATVHFLICFVMGFFTGIAPTSKSSMLSTHVMASIQSELSQPPVEIPLKVVDKSTSNQTPVAVPARSTELDIVENADEDVDLNPRRLIIVVTPSSAKNQLRGVLLRRLANTLKLVPPPLLWVVVEQQSDSSQVSEILRKTGVMYRHLVFKENFTDLDVEMDHQKNVALNHIEHHKLSGIVHFAGLDNVYDLSFFDEIREIEVFGTWPMAFLSANRQRVVIEGPVCDSSEVIGWHFKKMKDNNIKTTEEESNKSPIHISSFSFNSSILWDPERWGRPSSVLDTSQNSLKFVEKEVLEEETKLRGIPSDDCSRIMLWNLRIPMKSM